MVKRIVDLPNVSGSAIIVGAFTAHTITLDIPVGPRYHVIWISGNAGAGKFFNTLFGDIRVKINGKTQRLCSALELVKINALNGAVFAGANGNVASAVYTIPIWFAEPWRKSLDSQDGLAWGTGDVSSFQIEIDVPAATGGAAVTTPTFTAEIDNSIIGQNDKGGDVQQPLGLITKWNRMQIPITAANTYNDFLGLRDLNYAVQSLHLTDANILDFELMVDNSVIRRNTVIRNAVTLKAREMNPEPASGNDCPTRGMYDIVFDHDDILKNALPLTLGGRKVGSVVLRLRENGGTVSRNIATVAQVIGPAE